MAAKSALPESESTTPGLDASLSRTVLWVPADPVSAMMERLSLALIVVGSGVFLVGGQVKQLAA